MKTLRITVVVLLIPTLLNAQNQEKYQCAIDEVIRRVEVVHETGVTVPCEVHYYKDTEMPGKRQVLWRAINEEGYCEAKAAAFVEKLRASGWTCWAAGQPGPEDESGAADDTDALAPADEETESPDPEID